MYIINWQFELISKPILDKNNTFLGAYFRQNSLNKQKLNKYASSLANRVFNVIKDTE
jgi:membrane protein implicated in regulation of membrane protease activity